ncbi:unnamed protein product [Phytophthora lilii]|uniref:Unnamed protein product n=1 Tax=Phytophthora lilii TaxID=2077276 RepID=A0A9W6X6V4_9STRA|nr:unnamed protein product [Phytophthora lilii]
MGKEDINTPEKVWQSKSLKRKRVNASDGDIGDRLLKSNGLRKKIVPILNGSSKSSSIDNDGYVWVDGNSISVYGKESDRSKSAITKRVIFFYLATYAPFTCKCGLRQRTSVRNGKNDEEIGVKEFTPVDGEARHGTMSGIDEDMDQNLSNADNDAKRILTDYYAQLHSNDIEIPFRLMPVVATTNGIQKHKQVSGAAWKGLMRTIRWMDTFTLLLDWFKDWDKYLNDDDDYPSPLNDEEAAKLVEEKKLDEQRRKNLDDNLEAINDAILKSVHDIRRQRIEEYDHDDNLQKLHDDSETAAQAGAGVAPLEGVVRRGCTYNLNKIQGLATPSAYNYKQLGSKYIRIPDLDAMTLVIIQPNRRKCGPKCQISDSLQAMIRTLVYKNHIGQASYDKLSIDDKKQFKEILAITHLQYNFHDKLTDPLETLRAEYDKLKGEMELGNDNPSTIKQL